MTPEQIAEMIAKSLEKSLPEAIGMVVEEKLKELNIDATTEEVATIKASLAQIVKDAKFNSGEDETDEKKLKTDQKYFGMFMKNLKKTGNPLKAVELSQAESKDFQSEGVDADGGFLIPESFTTGVLRLANAKGILRRYCTVVPMATETLNLRIVAADPLVGWVDEGALIPTKKVTFAKKQLVAKKLGALVPSTLELIDDSMSDIDIWNIAMEACVNSILRFEDSQGFVGDGIGSNFTGVLNDSGVIVHSLPETKTSFADISYDDIVTIRGKVDDESISDENNLKWFMNRQLVSNIDKIKDANGNPIFKRNGKELTLFGYNVVTVPALPGTTDDAVDTAFMIFGDMKAFYLGDRKKLTFDIGEASNDFASYKKSLRVIERIDGGVVKPKLLVVVKTAAA